MSNPVSQSYQHNSINHNKISAFIKPDHQTSGFSYYYRPSLPIKLANERYQLVGNLGSGSFGSVVLAKIRDGSMPVIREEMKLQRETMLEPIFQYKRAPSNLVAIKIMNKKLSSLEDYSRVKEVKFIMSVSSHPFLTQIFDVFVDKLSFKLHIVMESMNQNLYQLMKTRKGRLFSERTMKGILAQLLSAIRHIHRYRFFHRDVKPENILVMPIIDFYGSREAIPPYMKGCSYIIKLADYGLARHIGNMKPVTAYISTRWYRSPEILLRKKDYSLPVDIWAYGCVAAEVATFRPLLPGKNEVDQTWDVLELLGCPESVSTPNIRPPLGGYWDEAQILASNLGFCLPRLPGATMDKIIPRPDLDFKERFQLCEVVKSCLVWDPSLRLTAEKLSGLPYFDGTVIREEDQIEIQKSKLFMDDLVNLDECVQSSKRKEGNKENIKPRHVTKQRSSAPQQHFGMSGFLNLFKVKPKNEIIEEEEDPGTPPLECDEGEYYEDIKNTGDIEILRQRDLFDDTECMALDDENNVLHPDKEKAGEPNTDSKVCLKRPDSNEELGYSLEDALYL